MPKLDVLGFIEEKRKACNLEAKKRLLIVQVGDDPASNLYITSKMKEASKWNVKPTLVKLDKTSSQWDLKNVIEYKGRKYDGIIIQLPVPKRIKPVEALYYTEGMQDVDALRYDYHEPCTPRGIMMYLKHITDLAGKKVVVIGRGKTVGEPLIQTLLKENCTLTCCNSYTSEDQLKGALCDADVVISAVGEPELFMAKDLQPGCIVIDAGISRVDGKQVGDFSHEGNLDEIYYTPWTNGVGKLTVAALMMNVRGE